ncbi:MAG: hypothetical protein LBF51_04770 [Zoogloeaceae bacterium]|jgi:hypothetical protein|nr:hypothetical protein [Zoogloeaceae bacterium]
MQIYNYSASTGEYTGEGVAFPSPLEAGVYLVPANATTTPPPQAGEYEAALFDVAQNQWTLAPDYRGVTLYDKESGAELAITAFWETPGDYPDHTEIAPPELAENQRAVWQGDAWGVEDIPPPVPASVTMRQARLALLGAGLLDTVDAAVAGMSGDAGKAARIEWEFAATIDRDNPLFAGLTAQLGMTSAQLDALFTAAATL